METITPTKLTTNRDYILPPATVNIDIAMPRNTLKSAIVDTSRALGGKSSLPILSTVLLRAAEGCLSFTATNLTLALSRQIRTRSSDSWALCASEIAR